MIEVIFLILIVFLVIGFLTSIIISIWVYKDAKKRDSNVFLWILLIWLIPFLLGFLLYLKNRD
jgi:hypothetical protein